MNYLHLVFDVEADGPYPGANDTGYSMVSVGFKSVFTDDNFYQEFKPISNNYSEEALKVCGFTRDQTLLFPVALQGVAKLQNWIEELQKENKLICWSDNPAFDWQFVNYYLHSIAGENPLGFSCRRIGDLYAGLTKNITNASKWKQFRKTKHSHNSLDDATGNAEALKHILSLMRNQNV